MNYIFIFIILIIAELIYFRFAKMFNIIDKPNNRSSHSNITLRGGGIIFYIGALIYFITSGFQNIWFIFALTLVSIISFIDDLRPQSFVVRILTHLISILILFYQLNLYFEPWYIILLSLFLCLGILNAFNFMDGINGITGLYSIIVIASFWYVNNFQNYFVSNQLLYIILISLSVFGFFNFRKNAKCFAGDIGSLSISFIIIFIFGLLIVKTRDFSYMVFVAVYGVDTGLTIIHRIILKENILKAHRMHVFQLMANELKMPHLVVSTIYALLQLFIVIGYFAFKNYSYLYLAVVCLMLIIAYISIKSKYYKLHQSSN